MYGNVMGPAPLPAAAGGDLVIAFIIPSKAAVGKAANSLAVLNPWPTMYTVVGASNPIRARHALKAISATLAIVSSA